jgi:ribosomal protein L11 methyltransferase
VQPGARVLDVGTGSGILAIAAGKLQASLVLGLDIDPLAVRVAHQNLTLNGLELVVEVQEGTLETGDGKSPTIGDATWDVIVVNILAEPIIEMSAIWRVNMAARGVLITSGIIAERADAVIASLRQAGLTVVKRRDDAQWVVLLARAQTGVSPPGAGH